VIVPDLRTSVSWTCPFCVRPVLLGVAVTTEELPDGMVQCSVDGSLASDGVAVHLRMCGSRPDE
jgi:hypothetical protein